MNGMTISRPYLCPNEDAYFAHLRLAEEALGKELDSVDCRPDVYPCFVSIIDRGDKKATLTCFHIEHAKKLMLSRPGTGHYEPNAIPSQLKDMLMNMQESLRYSLANLVAITRVLDEAGLADKEKMRRFFAIVLSEIDARTVTVSDAFHVDQILARASGDRHDDNAANTETSNRKERTDPGVIGGSGEGI